MKKTLLTFALAAVISAALSPSAFAAARTWGNTGTDFNTAGNWVEGTAPGTSDHAVFNTAATQQPNLSTSLTIQQVLFSTAAASPYTLSSSGSNVRLTLTATGNQAANSALVSSATSGTNTVSAPIVLGAASGSQTFFKTGAAPLFEVSGPITATNTGVTLNFNNSAGELRLSGLIDSTLGNGMTKTNN